jgi:hypothetical protein
MLTAKVVRYWLNVHSHIVDDAESETEMCMNEADIVRFCDEIVVAHEEEIAHLKEEMGKAQDLLGAAYGLLRRAREDENGQEVG